MDPQRHAGDDYCYLTTRGRVSGRPHRIEIWFALDGSTLYMLAGEGGRADWVRNLAREPSVTVELGGEKWRATARVVADQAEETTARRLVHDKYRPRYSGDLDNWRDTALPVAVDLPES